MKISENYINNFILLTLMNNEGMVLGKGFMPRFGRITEQMPLLRAAGETPISLDMALMQQYAYPDTWGKTYVFTGDAVITGRDGDVVIDKNSALLYALDGDSKLKNHALVLSDDEYERARYGYGVTHLSAREIANVDGKGFVKVRGIWQPENRIVGYVWDALTDGRDLKEHAELASQRSNNALQVMCLYFDYEKRAQATLRAWGVDFLYNRSFALGFFDLDRDSGRLVGVVAPEALEEIRSVRNDPAQLRDRLVTGLRQYVAPATLPDVVQYVTNEAVRFAGRE